MKKEIYQCLVQLEALSKIMKRFMDGGIGAAVFNLEDAYNGICDILKENLSEMEFEHIHLVKFDKAESVVKRKGQMRTLYLALEMTIAYLKSFDMNFDKEKKRKENEFKEKEKEFKLREENLKQSQKIVDMLLNPKTGLPELIRSGIVRGVKENHRGIEKSTNPKTKSQRKKIISN